MPRNLDRRVEAMLRVTDPNLRARLDEILELNLADDVLAWTLEPDGTWRKVPTVVGLESHVRFQELAVARPRRSMRTRRSDDASSAERGDRRRRDQARSRSRELRRRGCRARSGASAAARTPKPSTKRASRPAACAPTCARSATSSTTQWANELRAELQWLGAELGEVRDIEVMLERLRDDAAAVARQPNTKPAIASFAASIADWHAARHAHDRAARPDLAFAALRAPLEAAAERPRCTPWAHLPRDARRSRRSCSTRGGSCETPSTISARHRPTTRCTRCGSAPSARRYAAEATIPVFGKPAQRFARAIADVQDVLGEHQDAVVAARGSRRPRASARPAEAFAAGMLAERRDRRRRRGPRPRFPRSGRRARGPKLRRVAVSRDGTVEAAGGDRAPRPTPDGARGPRRPPAEVRRLEPAEGQARARRDARGRRGPRGRRGDRLALRARRGAPRRAVHRPATAGPKHVRYWQHDAGAVRALHAERGDRRRPLDFAPRSRDTALLRRRPAPAAATSVPVRPEQTEREVTIYLVRHAKAGDRASWPGDDFLRPLSRRGPDPGRGARRACSRTATFDRLLSSPYVRCMEIARAARGVRRIPIEPVDAITEGASLEDALDARAASTRITTRCCAGTATSSRCCSSTTRPRRRPRHGPGVPEGMHVGPRDRRRGGCRRRDVPRAADRVKPEELRRRGSAGSSCGPWMSSEPELPRLGR